MIILGYHRVNPEPRGVLSVTCAAFRLQLLHLLQKGYRNVSLEQVADGLPRLPRRSFAITFDDGYRDNLIHALPILRELRLTATLFVVVNYIDTHRCYPWDEQRSASWGGDLREEDLCVTWAQLEEMQTGGTFTVGSHTLSHPELTRIEPAAAREELRSSKVILEERLGRHVSAFCYPRGDLNREVVRMVGEAGYRVGVVTPDRAVPRTPFTLPRIGAYAGTTESAFALKTSPAFQLLLRVGLWPSAAALRRRVTG